MLQSCARIFIPTEVLLAIYRYQSDKVVQGVHIEMNEHGGRRAYIEANPGGSPDDLRAVTSHLESKGWKAVPATFNGKPTLEVRGFKKPEELTNALVSAGFVEGEAAKLDLPTDKRTIKQQLGTMTLFGAGALYNIGDISYLYYTGGPMIETWKKKMPAGKFMNSDRFFSGLYTLSGIGYGLGSYALTFHGSSDKSQHIIQDASRKVEQFARREGLEVHKTDSPMGKINRDPKMSWWGALNHTVSKYPSETLNSIYVGVGACITAAAFYNGTRPIAPGLVGDALKHAKKEQRAELIDVGLGALTASAALIGLLVKEKPRDKDEPPPKGMFARAWQWVEEKPLRTTGFGYMGATLVHGWATVEKWKLKGDHAVKKKHLVGRAIFVITNLMAEGLLMLSSKGHGEGVKPDESVDATVISATADMVLRQPEARREALIENLAGHLADPKVMGGKAPEIAEKLRAEVDQLQKNPWSQASRVAKTPTPVIESTTPDTKVHAAKVEHKVAAANENGKAANDDWKEHVVASKAEAHAAGAAI